MQSEVPNPQSDPTRRFSSRVEYYVRSRPKYPQSLIKFMTEELNFRSTDRVADIGSGTGFLSEIFVYNGNPVMAVEPNANMRAAAEKLLGGNSNFHSIDGKAEATGLASSSVDWVLTGQAFHWFDRAACRLEFARILKAAGYVGIVWNHRRTNDPFEQAYDRVVKEFQTGKSNMSHQLTKPGKMEEFFAPGHCRLQTFANTQTLDCDGLIARALSSSNLPLPPNAQSEAMVGRLREIFARYSSGEMVLQNYDTLLYYGRL